MKETKGIKIALIIMTLIFLTSCKSNRFTIKGDWDGVIMRTGETLHMSFKDNETLIVSGMFNMKTTYKYEYKDNQLIMEEVKEDGHKIVYNMEKENSKKFKLYMQTFDGVEVNEDDSRCEEVEVTQANK